MRSGYTSYPIVTSLYKLTFMGAVSSLKIGTAFYTVKYLNLLKNLLRALGFKLYKYKHKLHFSFNTDCTVINIHCERA